MVMVAEMTRKGYDNLDLNYRMLLDLPFNEGIGTVTRDIAKPHHQDVALAGVGAPTWGKVALSNANVLSFGGNGYLECLAADTADLDFTSGDYSILCWVNPIDTSTSMNVAGRYCLDIDGWELYLFDLLGNGYLTLRHHHASLAEDRDGCYSTGWVELAWQLIGVSRSGLYPVHYRNGAALAMTYGVNGMRDPDSAVRDLVIGARYTKNSDWYKGSMKQLRIINGALTASDMLDIFKMERHLFGV